MSSVPVGVVQASAGSRGSPRRAGPPADVSDAVASLLSLPIAPNAADEDRTQVSDQDISPSVDSSATETAVAAPPPSAQARHNATERQRVRKLKSAYMELDEVIRSRPDLVNTRTLPEEMSSHRRRSRSSDPEEGSNSRAPAGPSHLAILQESAAAVRSLFSLVDSLVRRNHDLENTASKSADRGV